MPLIILGVLVLFVAFIISPLIGMMLTNPLVFGVGAIILGILWVVTPKIFNGILFVCAKPYFFYMEVIKPKLENKKWWKVTVKGVSVVNNVWFKRIIIYGVVVGCVFLVIYFNHNPLIN